MLALMKFNTRNRAELTAVVAVLGLLLISAPASAQRASLVGVERVREIAVTQTVPVIGHLVALKGGDVAARIAGPLEALFVEVGDRVKAGQKLCRLNVDTLQAELVLAQSELAEAKADLAIARAEAAQVRAQMRRIRELRKSAAFSRARFEDTELRHLVALSKISKADARIATKTAAVARRALDVRNATVTAPYDGVVMRTYAEIGAYIKNGDSLIRLIGDTELEVEADVPQSRLQSLKQGRLVSVVLGGGPRLKARVRAVLPSENPLTRTRAVRMTIIGQGSYKGLAEGQSATVEVPVRAARQVLSVHKDAVLNKPSGNIVFVVTNGVAKPRKVQLGEAIGARLEVLGGLAKGDVVVVRGNERLRPGAKVRFKKGSS